MTTSESGRETAYDDRETHREGVPAGYKWILVDLIKSFQKSIGSMGPRRRPAKKEKVLCRGHTFNV